jgi:hypothetical protein
MLGSIAFCIEESSVIRQQDNALTKPYNSVPQKWKPHSRSPVFPSHRAKPLNRQVGPPTVATGTTAVRPVAHARLVGVAENGYWFGSASVPALTDPRRNTVLGDLLVRYQKAARWARDNPSEWAR